jgi:LemA protein
MGIFIISIILLIVVIIFIYNRLVKLNLRCQNALAGIDNQLKRRSDLIPNLVNVTKGYAKYESDVLIKVISKRSESLSEKASDDEVIKTNLTKIFALSESYPDLKANEIFKKLQVELTGTEDKIAYARQFYNDSVQFFNSAITIFPNNVLASIMKLKEKEYFKISEEERKRVDVKL